jgi:hypothetical protein
MILVCLLAAGAALLTYVLTARLGAVARAVIALLVFLVPTVSAMVWAIAVGDRAPSGAVIVQPKSAAPHDP